MAILTNLLAPYRAPVFERLADHFEVTVLCSGKESNRAQWRGTENDVSRIKVRHSRGFTFAWTKRDRGAVLDTRYLHITPGLFTDLLRLRPDALVSDEMGFRTLVALGYGWLFDRPVWVWWGGTLHTERTIGPVKRVFRRHLAPRVRRWFSYGRTSTEYLVSLGVDPHGVVELQNCVQEQLYRDPAPPAFALTPKPILICVGRLVPGKGVDLFLRAAARVQAGGFTFSILVVGDGPERDNLEQTVRQLSLRNVYFSAAHTPRDMPAIYRSGDVLVFPTLDDVWGLVVNEALWSGLPALVSNYAGCAGELVPESNTFDPLDLAEFVAKLQSAVKGELAPPDLTRLKTLAEVADEIALELAARQERR